MVCVVWTTHKPAQPCSLQQESAEKPINYADIYITAGVKFDRTCRQTRRVQTEEWTKTPFRLWIETGRRKDDRPNRPTYYYDWQCFGLAKSETEPNVLCISYANPKEKHRLILSIDDSNQFADYYNYLRSVLPRASPCCRFFNKCTKKASKIGGALWRYVNFERRTAKAGRSRSDADPKGAKLSASTPIAAQTRALNKDTIDDDFGQYFQGAQEPRAWRTTGCPGR